MSEIKLIDHLFRHQYGILVAILTRSYGLHELEMIEDVVQDTFIKALAAWRSGIPDNPEAWLTRVAKNRAIDVLRKTSSDTKREVNYSNAYDSAENMNQEIILENEIHDSQLRMIFTACHPILKPKEQITFALKTISGFSIKEIAASLLTKEETIKKNISRSRKVFRDKDIQFEIPQGHDLVDRIQSVHDVLYLIFNEGFHSTKKDMLLQKDLCFEAMRLCKILMQKSFLTQPDTKALFALMCFHAARLDSKMGANGEMIPISNQDRSLWHNQLIRLGNQSMIEAVEADHFSSFHYEAAIAAEHLKAPSFEATDWDQILLWYNRLIEVNPNDLTRLNMAVVLFKLDKLEDFEKLIKQINPQKLEQRIYLYYTLLSDYYVKIGDPKRGLSSLRQAINLVRNESEHQFLLKKEQALN